MLQLKRAQHNDAVVSAAVVSRRMARTLATSHATVRRQPASR
jgi:hypothetical protein